MGQILLGHGGSEEGRSGEYQWEWGILERQNWEWVRGYGAGPGHSPEPERAC